MMFVEKIDFGSLELTDDSLIDLTDDVTAFRIDDNKVVIFFVGSVEVYPMHRVNNIYWSGGSIR